MRLRILFAIIVALSLLLQGCGHKAPLFMPTPAAVGNFLSQPA